MKKVDRQSLRERAGGLLTLLMLLHGGCVPCAERQVPPSTQPAATRAATTAPDETETFQIGKPGDLQVELTTPANPADHFPKAIVKIYNASNKDLIVGYEPGCIVVHCGGFEQRAPGMTFTQRREILRPRQPLEFEMPTGGWMRSPGPGGQDLLIPLDLPTGKYAVWATFQLSGSDKTIQSPRDTYVVP